LKAVFEELVVFIEETLGDVDQSHHWSDTEVLNKLKDICGQVREALEPVKAVFDSVKGENELTNQVLSGVKDVIQGVRDLLENSQKVIEIASAARGAMTGEVSINFGELMRTLGVADVEGSDGESLTKAMLDIQDLHLSLKKRELTIFAKFHFGAMKSTLDVVFTCKQHGGGSWSWVFGAVYQNKVQLAEVWTPLEFFDKLLGFVKVGECTFCIRFITGF
jgi:hypothetical protein